MSPQQPSEALRLGRRALEGMAGVLLIEDLRWVEAVRRWTLRYRITIDRESEFVPRATDWYVLIEPSYPWGKIGFYPAKEGGIVDTFPHQKYNDDGRPDVPWRQGNICIDTSMHVIGRHGYDPQPYETEARLRWHAERTVEWLRDAAQDLLLQPGDHYELPHFPKETGEPVIVGFSEDATSFDRWRAIGQRCGLVTLSYCNRHPEIFAARSFQNVDGEELHAPAWGRAVRERERLVRGIWVRLPSVPILPPWKAPATWDELRDACERQGIRIFNLLEEAAAHIRDGRWHPALIGFPIPKMVGETPSQMHWRAISLPILTSAKTADGFRKTEEGYRARDRSMIWAPSKSIPWIVTENWHGKEISSRGKLPDALATKNVLLIGAGAVGSLLAEMLVRAGIRRMTIIDKDLLDMGNLSRHTLHMDDAKRPKASALAERLNLASPHTDVDALVMHFPPKKEEDTEHVRSADIVIDASAEDGILPRIEQFPWGSTKAFYSFSLGLKARRIYCYGARGDTFPMLDYREQMNPLIRQDKDAFERSGEHMPREGTGCWHRLFPARIDDVEMMVPIAVKFIEAMELRPPATPRLHVYEQVIGSAGFEGIRRVER